MMMPVEKDSLVVAAGRTEELLARELVGSDSVALLDFPSHMNVGDSMIWAGEMDSLRRIGRRVRYAADHARYDPAVLQQRHPLGPILLHGGGNFGDLWPEFQRFRERVLLDFPGRKVIQLPQSVHFRDRVNAGVTNSALRKHPDFLLLCRDKESFSLAAELLPDVRTERVPDAAFGWKVPAQQQPQPNRGTLVLLRRDHESQPGANELLEWCRSNLDPARTTFADWGLHGRDLLKWRLARVPGSLARRNRVLGRLRTTRRAVEAGYEKMLDLNLRAGIDAFSDRSLIVTDRLHAHVLAAKMHVRHVVMDNSYGKIRAVGEEESLRLPTAFYAAGPAEAIGAIKSSWADRSV